MGTRCLVHRPELAVASVLQVSVDENPHMWWQHAGRAVLTERTHAVGPENSRWGLTHRRYYRRMYHTYYLRYRSYLLWLLDAVCGNPRASWDALMQLESQLGEGEIAQFRWWAWASQQTRRQVRLPFDIYQQHQPEELRRS